MKLQARTALVPLITVTLLSIGVFVLVSKLTISSFSSIESEVLHRQVDRVNNAISNLVDEHAKKIVDWAQWDRTYDFMQSQARSYIEENLNAKTLVALGLDSAMYFTPELKLHYGVTVSGANVSIVTPGLVEEVRKLLQRSNLQATQGLVRLRNDVFMFAASPILPNKGDQPPRGILVATSKFSPETVALIGHLTSLKLRFWQKEELTPDAAITTATMEITHGAPIVINSVAEDIAYAYSAAKDTSGNPVMFFRLEDSRKIVTAGINVRTVSTFTVVGIGLLTILLLVLVINLSATRRIEQFSEQVKNIVASSDASKRLLDIASNSRSLRYKTTGGVLLVFAVTTVVMSTLLNRHFLRGFENIEEQMMREDTGRATRALTARLDKLKGKTIDWAQWDDTYQFIQDHNQDYITANLGYDTLGPMKMKYVLFFDSENRLVDGREVRPKEETVVALDDVTSRSIADAHAISRASQPVAGFLSLPGGTILAAASPILDTERKGNSRGSMVFGFSADDDLAHELGSQTRLNLHFRQKLPTAGLEQGGAIITRLSQDELEGDATVPDVMGKPTLGVVVESARPIYEQGLLAARILPIYLIVGGVICSLFTLVWVNRVLLSRIQQIGKEADSIKRSADTSIRVTDTGTDELSGLARDINSMLAALQITQVELAKAKKAAEHANRAKSMFIAKVSHELRNPIHGIRLVNDLIMKREGSRAVRDLVRMGDSAAESLLTIVDEILDVTKAEAGQLTFEKIPYEMRQIVRETMQVMATRLEGKYRGTGNPRVQLVCDVHSVVPQWLKGDPTRLKQILINLLSNAIKFTENGFVGLEIKMEGENSAGPILQIVVWDTGIGIPEEKQQTIFEPFKQADETTTRKYQGTGLGLSIVKQFTEGMGGDVALRSSTEGSVFTVTLPQEVVHEVVQVVIGDSSSAHGRAISEKKLPANSLLLAQPSPISEVLTRNLSSLGVPISLIDPIAEHDGARLRQEIANVDMLVVSEEAFGVPEIWGIVEDRICSRANGVIAMLRPASIDLAEKLYKLKFKYVLSTPVLADDLLLAYQDELPRPDAGAPHESVAISSSQRKLNVLIADDAATNRYILEELLIEGGHTVVPVSDGSEVVEHLRAMIMGKPGAQSFDLVITDVTMPIMNGDEAVRIIRGLEDQHTAGKHIPVIALTGHVFPDELDKIKSSGVDAIITKPMTPEKLAAEIRCRFPA